MMVETLESPQQIVIPAGTSSNSILTLERKGAHKLGNKSYRGNHYVHLQVSTEYSEQPIKKNIDKLL